MHVFNRYLVKAVAALFSVGLLGWWLLGSLFGTVPGRYNPRTETYDVRWYKTGFKCVNGYFRIKLYTPSNGRTYHMRYNEKDGRFYWYRGTKEISE